MTERETNINIQSKTPHHKRMDSDSLFIVNSGSSVFNTPRASHARSLAPLNRNSSSRNYMDFNASMPKIGDKKLVNLQSIQTAA
jgi:hypothetical protein